MYTKALPRGGFSIYGEDANITELVVASILYGRSNRVFDFDPSNATRN